MDESTEAKRKAKREAQKIRYLYFMRSVSDAYYYTYEEVAPPTSEVDPFDSVDSFDSFNPRYVNLLLSIEIGLKLCIACHREGEIIDSTGHNLHQLFNLLNEYDKHLLSIYCSLSIKDIEENLYEFCNDFTNERYIYAQCLDCTLFKKPLASKFIRAFANAVNTYIHEIPYPEY